MSYRPECDKQFREYPSEKRFVQSDSQDRRCGLWVRNNLGRLLKLHVEKSGDPFYESCRAAYKVLMAKEQ